jgi:glycosyltransferase involved in cell wall biosynthesis
MLESVAGLRAHGWRVVVTLPARGSLVEHIEALGGRVRIAPTVVLRKSLLRPAGLLTLITTSLPALRAAWRLIRSADPDVVYVNTVTVPLWILVARLLRRSVLVHVHEAEDTVPRIVRAGLAAPMLLAKSVVVNSKATAVLVTSSVPGLGKKIDLVYNGVPGPDQVTPPRSSLVGPIRLVQVGRLSPRKGTDLAIDALAVLRSAGRDVTLELLGSVFPGYEWYEQQLRDQATRLGLLDHVTFSGFAPSVWDAYERADIALVPSRAEPFGNAAVEAQLAQRPVIVTRVQGLVETVEDGRWGDIVPGEDAPAIAAAVAHLIDGWDAACVRAAAARTDAQERFGPDRFRDDIAEVVERVRR